MGQKFDYYVFEKARGDHAASIYCWGWDGGKHHPAVSRYSLLVEKDANSLEICSMSRLTNRISMRMT